jgi:hypothetical protein
MKRYVLAGILGVFIIATVSLAFLAAEKPSPGYSWKAVILDSSANMTGGYGGVYDSFLGGWVYNDSDEFTNVKVFIRTYSSKGNTNNFYAPVLALEVLSPTQIGLQGIVIGEYGSDPALNSCGFPNTQGGVLPFCWDSFLSLPQPASGCQSAQFMHEGKACMTKEEADFNTMEVGIPRVMHLSFWINGQNIYGTCDECDPLNYHQVTGKAHGYLKNGTYDISLTRESLDTWRVIVNTAFDNQDYNESFPSAFSWQDDIIWESYCDCVYEKVKKREVLTKKTQYSSWARAPIHYEMLFIRTPK